MSKPLHEVSITSERPGDASILLDGVELKGVTSLSLGMRAGEAHRLHVTLVPGSLLVNGKVEVEAAQKMFYPSWPIVEWFRGMFGRQDMFIFWDSLNQ